ncbi:MAG: hypothetical protein C4339_06230 [Nitrososphaerota archaeon]
MLLRKPLSISRTASAGAGSWAEPEEYIIEVHGSEAPIVHRMEKAGFKGERVAYLGSLLSI